MNNNQTSNGTVKSKNIIGIISTILSIVAIAGSWVPILNIGSIIIAIVGIILGIWSFINVLRKKLSGIAFPILSIILGIISIAMASNMNNAVVDSVSNSSGEVVGKVSGNSSSENTQTEYKVGDVIAFDDKEVTVTKVDRNFSGSSFDQPKSGYEFIKLSVKLENKSSRNISVGTYDFKM